MYLFSEGGGTKEEVTSAPTGSENGDERAGTSAAPTMWLGAQNGWWVSHMH